MHVCIIGLTFLVIVSMLHEATCKRQKRGMNNVVNISDAAQVLPHFVLLKQA